MCKTSTFFVAVLAATCALAAPTQKHKGQKNSAGSFKVPVHRGRHGSSEKVDTLHEMKRIFTKFDWDIVVVSPSDDDDDEDDDDAYTTISFPDLTLPTLLPLSQSYSSKSKSRDHTTKSKHETASVTASSTSSTDSEETTTATDLPWTVSSVDSTSDAQAPASTSYVESTTSEAAPEPTSSVDSTTSEAVPEATSSTDLPSTSSLPATTTTSITSTTSTSSRGAEGTVAADPEANQSEYLSPVTIGGQSLNLDFDTGSADLWVFSSELPASETGSHTVFDPNKSTTWSNLTGYTWQISYGDGSGASGTVGLDVVNIGGATVTSQAVEIATAVSDSFVKDTNNDGLVGLAFSSINTVRPTSQKTFFDNVMSSLDQPLFTADLRKDNTGTYEFGTIDSTKYQGTINYTPIDNSKGFWQFPSTSYTINGQTYQNTAATPAIADTGTSLVLVDDAVAKAYYDQVPGSSVSDQAGGYVYPCSDTTPDFGVAIGTSGFTAVIKSADVTFAQVGDGTCFGSIQSNGGGNLQIYGDALLKQYFAVFNGGSNTFGLAEKA